MKKLLAVILALTLMTLCLTACGSDPKPAEPVTEPETETQTGGGEVVVGGWTLNFDDTTGYLPEDVKAGFDKALEGFAGVGYTPVALLGTQVVNGLNAMLLCKATTVTAQPEKKYAVVTVYIGPESAEISNVSDFILTDYLEDNAEGTTTADAADGGWAVYAESPTINLPAEAADALTKALDGYEGCSVEPLALLGSQVVSGLNYAYLCKMSTVSPEPVSSLAVVKVYASLDGKAEITAVHKLDIPSLAK